MAQKLTKQQLENKIAELNEWLRLHEKINHVDYALNLRDRNYYVSKLIELEEYGYKEIEI